MRSPLSQYAFLQTTLHLKAQVLMSAHYPNRDCQLGRAISFAETTRSVGGRWEGQSALQKRRDSVGVEAAIVASCLNP